MMPPAEVANTEHHCIHNDDAEEEENKKQEREGCQRGGGAVACKSAHAEAHAGSTDTVQVAIHLRTVLYLLLAPK